MTWWRHLITGADNETVAIGRVLGLAVAAVFIFAVPIAALIALTRHSITGEEWQTVFSSLQVYVPAILLSVAGVIGLTVHSEPKGGGDGSPPDPT